ncbi:MAG: hypothetical protein KBT04_02770 [Bacteroidales bacterium]|nr:hypothetical protein [Candidatus Colimorpha onthohippi]
MRYIFVINGKPTKAYLVDEVKRQTDALVADGLLDKEQYQIYCTTAEGDATRYVHLFCDIHTRESICFVACGGDGIINEVASGLVGFEKEDKHLSIFTYKSNSDFAKNFPGVVFSDIKGIVLGNSRPIDIIKCGNGYCLNVCNVGFAAKVAVYGKKNVLKGRKKPYEKGIAEAVLFSRFNHIKVYVDGEKVCSWMLFCDIANGRICGDGYICSPNALIDDGWIDISVAKMIPLIKFLQLLPHYSKGTHLTNPKFKNVFTYRKAKEIRVVAPNHTTICPDGELLGGFDFLIKILPGGINFITPAAQ